MVKLESGADYYSVGVRTGLAIAIEVLEEATSLEDAIREITIKKSGGDEMSDARKLMAENEYKEVGNEYSMGC